MRKINESDFVNYTIDANGWTLTVNTFQNAVNEWKGLNRSGCNLYGNKADGSRAIIDTK